MTLSGNCLAFSVDASVILGIRNSIQCMLKGITTKFLFIALADAIKPILLLKLEVPFEILGFDVEDILIDIYLKMQE